MRIGGMVLLVGICAGGMVEGGTARVDSTRLVLARELVSLVHIDSYIEKSREVIQNSRRETLRTLGLRMEQLPPELRDVLDKTLQRINEELDWDSLREQYVVLFAESFTEEELTACVAFFTTGTGAACAAKIPALTGRIESIARKHVNAALPRIERRVKEMVDRMGNAIPSR